MYFWSTTARVVTTDGCQFVQFENLDSDSFASWYPDVDSVLLFGCPTDFYVKKLYPVSEAGSQFLGAIECCPLSVNTEISKQCHIPLQKTGYIFSDNFECTTDDCDASQVSCDESQGYDGTAEVQCRSPGPAEVAGCTLPDEDNFFYTDEDEDEDNFSSIEARLRALETKQCEPWCHNIARDWTKKCTWKLCTLCEPCLRPFRG